MQRLLRFALGALLVAGLAACMAGEGQDPPAAMEGKKVYIVHGYRAGPQDHWFQWLASQVRAAGGEAHVLTLPNSADPDPDAWNAALRRDIPRLDENTYIVAHSLGTLATLRFLDGQQGERIGGLVLVSPFASALPAIPELDAFIARDRFDPARITAIVAQRKVILSTTDALVPPALSRALAASIDARVEEVPDAGHFLVSDGFETFPQVWATLQGQTAR